jgi:hypothetical protein
VKNEGQWNSEAQFMAQGPGVDLWVTSTGLTLDFHKSELGRGSNGETDARRRGHVVRVSFEGPVGGGTVVGSGELPGRINYFRGNDPSKWVKNAVRYEEATVVGVLPSVDARFYFDQGLPRYDLIVKPGADAASVKMRYEGAANVQVGRDGRLRYETSLGAVEERGLFVYQTVGNQRQPVSAGYKVNSDGTVGFNIGAHDKTKPLVIDPIVWSNYVGGTSADSIRKMAMDGAGDILAAGNTTSSDLPVTVGAYDTSASANGDVFVAKLKADGTGLVYATYLGGGGTESVNAIDVSPTGGAVVVGETTSNNFPTAGSLLSPGLTGTSDAFFTALSSNGASLSQSSYFGGSAADAAKGVALSGSTVFLLGDTTSGDLPLASTIDRVFQSRRSGARDLFLSKFTLGSNTLIFSTYLGGSADDWATDLTLRTGSPCLVGTTSSTNFLLAHESKPGLQKTYVGGASDGFLVGMNVDGTAVTYRNFIGGTGSDSVNAVALDSMNDIVLAGNTTSTNFPILDGFQSSSPDPAAFVLKVKSGHTLVFSTLFTRTGSVPGAVTATDVAVDAARCPIIVGQAVDRVTTRGAGAILGKPGSTNGYIARFSASGKSLFYGSYIGGSLADSANALVLDAQGRAFVGGTTASTTFPGATNANAGAEDGFLSHVTLPVTLSRLVVSPMVAPYRLPVSVGLDGAVVTPTGITLTSDSEYLPLPASVTVPVGASTVNLNQAVRALADDVTVNLTATFGAKTLNASVNLVAPVLTAITTTEAEIEGRRSLSGSVTAEADPVLRRLIWLRLVDATSGDPIPETIATVANSVIEAGQTTGNFLVKTSIVQDNVTARVKGPKGFLSEPFLIKALKPFSIYGTTTVVGGNNANITVKLPVAAPAGGYVVNLSSSDPAAQVPASVTVPAGAFSVSFKVPTSVVASDTAVTLTASTGGGSTDMTLTITK